MKQKEIFWGIFLGIALAVSACGGDSSLSISARGEQASLSIFANRDYLLQSETTGL